MIIRKLFYILSAFFILKFPCHSSNWTEDYFVRYNYHRWVKLLNDTEIEDILKYPNLENLDVSYNKNLSFLPLTGLTQLRELRLNFSSINCLKDLHQCFNLQFLDLYGSEGLTELPLTGLVALEKLDIRGSKIKELSMTEECKNLKEIMK